MVGNGTDCTKKGISSREMHALQRLERHRTDKSILTAAMACGIKKIRRRVQDIQKSNYAGGTGAVVMTSLCEIITKLLADASLNMLGSNWMQYVKKGREDS